MTKHRALIDTVYQHFNEGDYDSVEPYFAVDVETRTPGGTLKTRDEWRAMGDAFYAAVPDMKHEVVTYHEDGDTIVVEGIYSGTQTGPLATEGGTLPASGHAFAFPYVDIFELWISDLTEVLEAAGVDHSKAADFAWMLFASTEGALVFARAEHSMRALDLVERQLLGLGATLV